MEEGSGNHNREEIFSKAVRAGKRTYFFDVKTTRGNDLYLTITESKKRFNKDGKFYYEKHKLFLYKEDFEKFSDGLEESISKIQELKDSGNFEIVKVEYDTPAPESSKVSEPSVTSTPEENVQPETNEPTDTKTDDVSSSQFTDVSFDDLGSDEEVVKTEGSE
jgi:hypothetical protein